MMAHTSILDQDVVNKFNLPLASSNKNMKNNLEKPPDQEESMTNGGFSDSQFGDIADEENYNGAPAEVSASSPQVGNEDTVIFVNYGRPTAANLSGKYTSCTNKNESLSF